jgi:hypothetical protein
MGTEYLGLHAIGWHGMLKTWWDKLLAVLLLTTIVLGCLYFLFIIGKKLHARWKVRRTSSCTYPFSSGILIPGIGETPTISRPPGHHSLS